MSENFDSAEIQIISELKHIVSYHFQKEKKGRAHFLDIQEYLKFQKEVDNSPIVKLVKKMNQFQPSNLFDSVN